VRPRQEGSSPHFHFSVVHKDASSQPQVATWKKYLWEEKLPRQDGQYAAWTNKLQKRFAGVTRNRFASRIAKANQFMPR